MKNAEGTESETGLTITRRTALQAAGGLVAAGMLGAVRVPAEAAGSTTLTFWVISSFTTNPKAGIFKAAALYEKQNPGITINIQSFDPNSFLNKLIVAVKGGQGPDIASVDSAWVEELGAGGIATDITSQFAAVKSQFLPGPINTGIDSGKQYAVPWYTNNVALFWNKKMFHAAGLSAAPRNWPELVSFGKKLTAGGKYGLMQGGSGFGSYLWLPFAWQNGASLITGNQATFGSPQGLAAWQFYSDLFLTDKIVPPSMLGVTASWDQYYTPFMQEQVAMMTVGDWAIGALKAGNPNLQFGIAPLPRGKQGATVIGGYDLTIPSTSKNAAAAWNFIRWLTAGGQNWVLESYSRTPARKDVLSTPYASKDPMIEVFIKQGAVGHAQPNVPQWDNIINTILADAWEGVITGKSAPAKALAQAVTQANSALKS